MKYVDIKYNEKIMSRIFKVITGEEVNNYIDESDYDDHDMICTWNKLMADMELLYEYSYLNVDIIGALIITNINAYTGVIIQDEIYTDELKNVVKELLDFIDEELNKIN